MPNLAVGVFLTLFSLFTAGHIVLYKRDPKSAAGWVGIVLLFPGIGPLLYWLLGVNRIRTRARRWQLLGGWDLQRHSAPLSLPEGALPAELKDQVSAIRTVSDRVTHRPLVGGNRITILHSGEGAYPPMLEAIGAAKQVVYLSTYLFETNATGREFIDALIGAARRGIDVRVLIDGLGECYSFPRVARFFRKSPVRFARFLPLRLWGRGVHFNLRNHRKILAVDHAVGFTGGMNIGGRHLAGDAADPHRVVDLHFRVEGPVVEELEEVFLEDWRFATGESDDPAPHPIPSPAGDAFCRGISAGPGDDFEKLYWIVLGALSAARRRIRIMTPYFIPDRALLSALTTAALRGVRVEIILPRKNNLPYVAWATRAYLWELLFYGIDIYDQPPPFVHSKYLIVDQAYSLVGSANLDPRSLRLNFEFNLEIYDAEVAGRLSAHFDEVRGRSRKITIAEVDGRPFLIKLRDGSAKLFSPYL